MLVYFHSSWDLMAEEKFTWVIPWLLHMIYLVILECMMDFQQAYHAIYL
jgi:hypothetical protein